MRMGGVCGGFVHECERNLSFSTKEWGTGSEGVCCAGGLGGQVCESVPGLRSGQGTCSYGCWGRGQWLIFLGILPCESEGPPRGCTLWAQLPFPQCLTLHQLQGSASPWFRTGLAREGRWHLGARRAA